MMIPFSVERFMFYRGRKLYGFVVEGISRPGVIATVTGIVAERGLDITYYAAGTVRRGERGMGIFFVDFTGSTVKPEDLVEEFRGLDFVTSVKVIRPTIEGFIADDVAFPVMLGPHRAIIFSEPALRGFLIDFRRHLGSGGEAMLYYLGREVGAERARHIEDEAERIGATSVEDKFTIGAKIFMSLGYGILEVLELREETPYLRVRIHHSIECELGRGAGRTFSHYVRGVLDGYSSQVLDREMFAMETRCIAQGDPYCEFEINPKGRTLQSII
jgi:predicted hydrocarbon binding protein